MQRVDRSMSVELHLPDLPEVPLSLGLPEPMPNRRQQHRWQRLREGLSAYLPLLLMAALALATWWLVKQSPRPQAAAVAKARTGEPDYVMDQFALDRFEANGRLKLRIEGAQARHHPDTDRIEIDEARIRAFTPDGRLTQAFSKHVLGLGDGSELQLKGGAKVATVDALGLPLTLQSEHLHAFVQLQRVVTDLPVAVTHGSSELRAVGLSYDHGQGLLVLKGKVRATLQPKGEAAPPVSKTP